MGVKHLSQNKSAHPNDENNYITEEDNFLIDVNLSVKWDTVFGRRWITSEVRLGTKWKLHKMRCVYLFILENNESRKRQKPQLIRSHVH